MWAWFASASHASPPNDTVRLFEVDDGGGYVERMQLSADGALVVGRTKGSKVGFLLNTDTWERRTSGEQENGVGFFVGPDDGCEVAAVTTVPREGNAADVWVACSDGVLRKFDYTGSGVPTAVADATAEVDTELDGLWYDPNTDLLLAWSSAQGSPGTLHSVDPDTLQVDPADSPARTVTIDGFLEGVLIPGDPALLVISHGGSQMSHLFLNSTSTFVTNVIGASPYQCTDMCPASSDSVYCVDPDGSITEYVVSSRLFSRLPLDVDAPGGVGASFEPGDEWLAVTGNNVRVWEMEGGVVVDPTNPYFESPEDADNPIQDILSSNGYLFGGGEAGYLHVVTQNPWIFPEKIEIEALVDGELVPAETFRSGDSGRVSFAANIGGEFSIIVGGDRPEDGVGTVVQTGTLTPSVVEGTAGSETVYLGEADFEVDDSYAEGVGNVWILVESAAGDVGHGAAQIVVDNVPPAPGLSLGFGDGSLTAVIEGIPDADLDHYSVFVSDEAFTAAEYPSGGPVGFRAARVVTAEPGADPSLTIGGLENERTYYVAVRAYDGNGAESPMSVVRSEVPREVFSVAERVGDPGGTPCDTGASAPASAWGSLAALALAAFRRRRWAVMALFAPTAAIAADDDPWWRADTTPTNANFEVRYGSINLADPELDAGYAQNAHNLLQVEVGPQFFHVLEVDLGTGFFQELDFQRTADGQASDQRQMMTWYPFAVDATLRGHFVDEQPAVPFLRYGWDYVIWNEKYDASPGGPKLATRGAKFGTHYALGVNLLLDLVQPARASFLETRTGINDSWLTIEWRRQHVDGRERPWSGRDDRLKTAGDRPLDFSGDAITLGLKLDW